MKRSPTQSFVPDSQATRTQYGALCWRPAGTGVEILLVTSRDTGRWVIPKGWPIEGLDPAQSAAREAWEEAGARGVADPDCLGCYSYEKVLRRAPEGQEDQTVPCVVAVYALQVARQIKDFPEARQRRCKWFSPEKAAARVDEPELAALIAGFRPPGSPGDVVT